MAWCPHQKQPRFLPACPTSCPIPGRTDASHMRAECRWSLPAWQWVGEASPDLQQAAAVFLIWVLETKLCKRCVGKKKAWGFIVWGSLLFLSSPAVIPMLIHRTLEQQFYYFKDKHWRGKHAYMYTYNYRVGLEPLLCLMVMDEITQSYFISQTHSKAQVAQNLLTWGLCFARNSRMHLVASCSAVWGLPTHQCPRLPK